MALTVKEKVHLRGQAMRLKPVLKVGRNGFSEGVKVQLERLLTQHKLIKVRLEEADRHARVALAEQITSALKAEFIGMTGRMAVFYKDGEME